MAAAKVVVAQRNLATFSATRAFSTHCQKAGRSSTRMESTFAMSFTFRLLLIRLDGSLATLSGFYSFLQ